MEYQPTSEYAIYLTIIKTEVAIRMRDYSMGRGEEQIQFARDLWPYVLQRLESAGV